MNRRDPSVWALFLIALIFILLGGGGLAVIAWWIYQILEVTK